MLTIDKSLDELTFSETVARIEAVSADILVTVKANNSKYNSHDLIKVLARDLTWSLAEIKLGLNYAYVKNLVKIDDRTQEVSIIKH